MSADKASPSSPSPEESGPSEPHGPAPAASGAEAEAELRESEPRPSLPRRRRITSIAFLAFGGLVAAYLSTQSPREQHVSVVLGPAAPEVTELALQYIAEDGDLARQAHFTYPPGAAPRVVAHQPKLPNGDYRLHIDVDARGGRREVRRTVTLEGGSTQVDISSALSREDESAAPRANP